MSKCKRHKYKPEIAPIERPGSHPVIVTDYGTTVLSNRVRKALDAICPDWRVQLDNNRYRNPKVVAARKFMDDLETTVKTINYIQWAVGREPLPWI